MLTHFSKNKPSYYIHFAVMILIIFGFRFIPPLEPLTELGMRVLGIFCGAMYGWLLCDLVCPSLLALVLLGLSGYDSMNNVLASGLRNSTVIMIILFCAITSILSSAEIAGFIAHKMISFKFVEGRTGPGIWNVSGAERCPIHQLRHVYAVGRLDYCCLHGSGATVWKIRGETGCVPHCEQ